MRILLAFAAAFLLTAAPARAEELTLERLFASPSLSGPTPRLLKLSPDGRLATLLRNRADDRDRYDLWAVDTATGEARMLVDSARLGTGAQLSEEEMMRRERARLSGVRGIVNYAWSPDGRAILVPLDGDLYLAGLDGDVRRITATPETELDAQVSRTGRYLSFVRDRNLHVVDADGRNDRALTDDGGGTISWGSAEFVAQEEMDRTTGHWWSPGDRWLAVARVDEAPVGIVTRAAIGAEGTRIYQQRYPAAGTANARVELYVMAPDGSRRVRVDLGSDPDFYLARVDWTADGAALLVQRESRDQKRLDLLRVDPATGAARLLFSETSDSWINLHDNLKPLRDGSLIWSSERSGFSHLYRFRNGRWTQLTRGDWAVDRVAGVDERRGRVYFTGNLDTPLERHLYWVDMNRPGPPRRVTEAGWWNLAEMDEGATRALVTRSNPAQPPQVYLADASGRRIAWIEENRLDPAHPYAPFLAGHVAPTFGTLGAADGTELHYRMLSPPAEPGRRHPVFVQVYGGPGAGRQATRAWANPLHQYLVRHGWIVFSLDNRGSPDRGKAFENHLYRAMGTVEVADQLAGIAWLRGRPDVDPERIAVYGWSYGGYMVLKLLEAAPGAIAAGVAGAPVTRWELYDTHYTERYLGNPSLDPAPYLAAGAIPNAGRIADPLLVLHGMADDNVVFENSTVLLGALQAAGRRFEMMVYPGATHRVSGEGRELHLWRTITDFLDRRVRAAR
ncbi:MAG TPA: S9 family peptidase [Allosphingosinicella sp.]|nr:S9 family peptidase [Allosphingosinicella sp.]